MSEPTLKRYHARRQREVYRSAGWPYLNVIEMELLAAGFLEWVDDRMIVLRPAPKWPVSQLLFGVWMALAKATPVQGLSLTEDGVNDQGPLGLATHDVATS